jgi:hypothetical protein
VCEEEEEEEEEEEGGSDGSDMRGCRLRSFWARSAESISMTTRRLSRLVMAEAAGRVVVPRESHGIDAPLFPSQRSLLPAYVGAWKDALKHHALAPPFPAPAALRQTLLFARLPRYAPLLQLLRPVS